MKIVRCALEFAIQTLRGDCDFTVQLVALFFLLLRDFEVLAQVQQRACAHSQSTIAGHAAILLHILKYL